ncbi:hypothetical protein OSB04_020882 [Centaurea solstitialis]|uniref:Uncharacterized protein n=1 Tax=Centaurea solstitialis TaxID=347529 RepID=A0AA38ST52_9ASTR|nr:hypothetical protein OSB04_020882 [Centaurea solstitialis]
MIVVSGTVYSAKNLPSDKTDRCSSLTIYLASFLHKMILSFELPFALIPLLNLILSGEHKKRVPAFGTGTASEPPVPEPEPVLVVPVPKIGTGQNRFRFSKFWNRRPAGTRLIVINIYYLMTAFVHWLIHSSLPKVGNVLIGIRPSAAHPTRWLRLAIGFIGFFGYTAVDDWSTGKDGLIVFPVMAIYILSVIYLMFLKDVVVTYVEPPNINLNYIMEGGNNNVDRRP